MTDISHKNLSGSQLHENKGVATANDDEVLTVTGGASVFKKLTADNLTGTGNSFGGQLLHVRFTRTSGTVGGQLSANTTWSKRSLNSSAETNEIDSASISSSVISLPAGDYYIEGWQRFGNVQGCVTRLRNTTDSSTLVVGEPSFGSTEGTSSKIAGRFTLSGTKNVEFQFYVVTGAGTSGAQGSDVGSGEVEVYVDLRIWKVG